MTTTSATATEARRPIGESHPFGASPWERGEGASVTVVSTPVTAVELFGLKITAPADLVDAAGLLSTNGATATRCREYFAGRLGELSAGGALTPEIIVRALMLVAGDRCKSREAHNSETARQKIAEIEARGAEARLAAATLEAKVKGIR